MSNKTKRYASLGVKCIMKLNTLLERIEKNANDPIHNLDIDGISTNSSEVRPNDLFVAIKGYRVDGHDFIQKAIEAGAQIIIGEKDLPKLSVPYIKVENSRRALAEIACEFYGNPSRNKKMIGITGTNGKTTTSYMLKHILESAGKSCSLFGTVKNVVNGQSLSSTNTTPDALELNKQLALSEDEYIIMEVSSHGLSQYRVHGVEFDFCLFTNLDQDHLDYHRDMEEYFSVKAGLFDQMKPDGKAVINHYNSWGQKLAEQLKAKNCTIHVMGDQSHYDLRIDQLKSGNSTIIFDHNANLNLKINILGKHNILNAAMAFLTASKMGLSTEEILGALELFPGVPGRFEMFQHPKGATVVVDYAHTADAFNHCLQTAKEEGAKRIFHIFGFRGNRDVTKRGGMVNVSKEISDVHILTFDDLNDVTYEEMEEALRILNEGGYIIPDRTLAIKQAVEHAQPGDWICITGKGAEEYQQKFELPTSSDIETVHFLFKQMEM